MKIKAKQYREFYLGCLRLYGLIDSNNAFIVFKHYYPDAKKMDFINDLKSRLLTFSQDYCIWKTAKRNVYLITSAITDEEEIENLISLQGDKPFYIPDNYDDFLNCASYQRFKKENEKDVNALLNVLKKCHKDKSLLQAEISLSILYEDIRDADIVSDVDPITMALKRLFVWGYDINRQQIEQIANYLMKLFNNMRHYANRGYTPNEMKKLSKPFKKDKVIMTIGPNMRKMFESGEMNAKEYLDGVINSDLPPVTKESLISELKKIIDDIDSIPKA